MLTRRMFLLQRFSALLLAPLVIAHLAGIIYAIHDGLTAAEILARTQGNLWWAAFYQLFVIAAAVHAAIGIRAVCFEWGKLRGGALEAATYFSGGALFILGTFAVYSVL